MVEEDIKRNKYWEFLPLAYEIYNNVFGEPKSHVEWANGFNIRGKIIKTLIESDGISTREKEGRLTDAVALVTK